MKLKRKNKNIIKKNGVYIATSFFAIILIGIGYAYLNSQINIVGRTKIAANTWNVHFDNLEIKEGSKEDATVEIVDSSTTVNFDINLEEQGEFLEFTVDVVNSGTIDAMLDEVVNKGISDESKKYLDYSILYIDGKEIQEKDFLAAGTEERIVVKAKYKDNIDEELLPEDDDIEDVSLTLSYVQSDNTKVDVNHTICKRAKTLHNDGTHTFGNETITQGVLTSGDAFDCDVNKDGIYDADTERFYYVTDLEENPSYAVLIYSNNVSNNEVEGIKNLTIDNTIGYAYDSAGTPRKNGPVTAAEQLPLRSQWENVKLYSPTRTIKDENGTSYISFNYRNHAARLLTYQEVVSACGSDNQTTATYLDNNCMFLIENTKYSNNSYSYGYLLETIYNTNDWRWVVYGTSYRRSLLYGISYNSDYGVRPVIEVPKANIKYDQDLPICKRATTLHTDGTHTFGSIGSGKKDLISGDAFDCDVNGDGIYNAETERFYYIKEDSNNRAVMVYYSNVKSGEPSAYNTVAYDSESTINGPQTAAEQLPTRTQWPRVTLANNSRPIKDEYGTTHSTFNYRDHVARLLTYQEVQFACGTGPTNAVGYLDSCSYLMEKTYYSNQSYKLGYWLENLQSNTNSPAAWTAVGYTGFHKLGYPGISYDTSYGVRPVIEVPDDKVDYGEEVEEAPVCVRATTLHTDGTHTFGSIGSGKKDLISGDAFDCDVNKDGTYDSATERFYYLNEDENGTASLVYYNNVAAGSPNNTTSFAYDTARTPRTNGPISAYGELPTRNQWRNVSLSNPSRTLTDEAGTQYSNFNYNSHAARLLTYQEVVAACGSGTMGQMGYLDSCSYLMENTNYSNNSYKYGFWLETVDQSESVKAWVARGGASSRFVSKIGSNEALSYGVRPVIEVPSTKINYGEETE